jgi:hypothetical protein
MHKKVITSGLIGVGMLAATGLSFGQNMPAQPTKPDAGVENKASEKRAIGEVTSVDAKTGKLAVKTAEQDLTLNVQASGTKKALESIKVGDKVNVSYRDQGGILVANSISKSGATAGAGS